METSAFYRVYREYGRRSDFALRMVIAEDGTPRGRYVGIGSWFTDVLLPEGQILKRITMDIVKEDEEEQVSLSDEAGTYSGIVPDEVLRQLLFRIHFASD